MQVMDKEDFHSVRGIMSGGNQDGSSTEVEVQYHI